MCVSCVLSHLNSTVIPPSTLPPPLSLFLSLSLCVCVLHGIMETIINLLSWQTNRALSYAVSLLFYNIISFIFGVHGNSLSSILLWWWILSLLIFCSVFLYVLFIECIHLYLMFPFIRLFAKIVYFFRLFIHVHLFIHSIIHDFVIILYMLYVMFYSSIIN